MARAAILWRRLRRYRLGGFQPEQCAGRFSRTKPELDVAFLRKTSSGVPTSGTRFGVVSLQHIVVLSETLASSCGQDVPGWRRLLEQLGDHCEILSRDYWDQGRIHK